MPNYNELPIRELELIRRDEKFGFQHYIIRYELGQEAKVLEYLIEKVNSGEIGLDWFDAAVLSHQLGQHLAQDLKKYLNKKEKGLEEAA